MHHVYIWCLALHNIRCSSQSGKCLANPHIYRDYVIQVVLGGVL